MKRVVINIVGKSFRGRYGRILETRDDMDHDVARHQIEPLKQCFGRRAKVWLRVCVVLEMLPVVYCQKSNAQLLPQRLKTIRFSAHKLL